MRCSGGRQSADGSREALLDGRLGRLVDPKSPDELAAAVTAVLETELPRQRMDAIEVFSIRNFTARVADWCRLQALRAAA